MIVFLRGGRTAWTFLTRIPVGRYTHHDGDFRWASAWFPVVGALLGCGYACVWSWLAPAAGPTVAAILCVAAALVATGAFHEDGLADSADALGGAMDRERLFEILKDSRIGTFGAAALGIALLLRVALIVRLGENAAVALVVSEAVSRVAPVWLMGVLPYVTPKRGQMKPVTQARAPQIVVATLFGAGVVAVAGLSAAMALRLVAVLVAVTALCGWRFWRRAGGITGDFLGATQQVALCATLLALSL
jgi:adenosylcobinamide-GDP ribazoletransferase